MVFTLGSIHNLAFPKTQINADILCIYMKKVTVQKWGNSYGIRIPKQTLDALQLKDKSVLYMDQTKDGIVLNKPSKEAQLAELLEQMHSEELPELVDWGEPVGKEFW